MDIHESFTLEEGAPSKKRKRGIFLTLKHVTLKYIYMLRYSLGYFSLIGPRNLNAKDDGKRKSIITGEENEIVELKM